MSYVVFTHDLDFSVLLAHTAARGPSVVQLRTLEPTPEAVGSAVVEVLRSKATEIERGAIVSIDPASARVRMLPIRDSTR